MRLSIAASRSTEMGFLEARAEYAARSFAQWQAGLWASDGVTVEVRPVVGGLEQVLSALLPLTDSERQRHLFIPTRSPRTAYVDNAHNGTDAMGTMRHMARMLGCLKEYLGHLGLSPFDENFYLPEGAPAWVVEKTGPLVHPRREYTLAQAREVL